MKIRNVLLIVALAALIVLTSCTFYIGGPTPVPTAPPPAQPPAEQPPPGQPPVEQPPGQPPSQPQPGEPQASFTADRTQIQSGECATLTWNVQGQNVFGVDINGQKVNPSGQQQVCPKESIVYVLSADTGKTMLRREVAITVGGGAQPQPQPPTSQPPPTPPSPSSGCPGPPVFASPFTANPSTITAGQSTTLSWGNVTNGTTGPLVGSLKLEPGFGEVGSGASQRVAKPNQTTTYTLTATGCGGTATKQVTVNVGGGLPIITLQILIFDLAIDDIYPEATGKISVRLKNRGTGDVTNASVPLNCSAKVIYVANPLGQATMAMPPINFTVNLKANQTVVYDTGHARDPSIQSMWVTCTITPALVGDNTGNNSLTKQVK
jgi:hypothetical protein